MSVCSKETSSEDISKDTHEVCVSVCSIDTSSKDTSTDTHALRAAAVL